MPAVRDEKSLDSGGVHGVFRDAIELRGRGVLVAVAENRDDRAADAADVLRDAPVPERGIEPDVVPAVERVVDVVVMAPELLAPARRRVQRARLADAFQVGLFHEGERRHRDHGRDAPATGAGVDQRHRRAGGVSDEHGIGDRERVAKPRQHVERFVVHEERRERAFAPRRLAVTLARVGDDAASGRVRELPGKLTPHRHRPHAFVEQQQLVPASIGTNSRKIEDLEAVDELDPRLRGDDLSRGHFGAIRMAPSSLITSPFRIWFSMMWRTSAAYSSGLPRRGGKGTCAPSDARSSSVMPATIGVSKMPGAIVITRTPNFASSRAMGSVMPFTPAFDAEYDACPIWPSIEATDEVFTITPRSPPSPTGCCTV